MEQIGAKCDRCGLEKGTVGERNEEDSMKFMMLRNRMGQLNFMNGSI